MPEVSIEVRPNGPYLVKGPITLIDPQGNVMACEKDVVALCRCGGSTTKPFCDGTHSSIGFQASGPEGATAVRGAEG